MLIGSEFAITAREEGHAASMLMLLSRWLGREDPGAGDESYHHMAYLCARDAAHAANIVLQTQELEKQ